MTMSTTETHLIVLCCHAIYVSASLNTFSQASPRSSTWLIAPFQNGEETTFTKHLQKALSLLASDSNALLVISGSRTRPEIDLSEARSYLNLANEEAFFGLLSDQNDESWKSRIVLEEKALDSFGNLTFSLVEFWRKTGAWPKKVTIVTHEFKRQRFLEVHRRALHIPEDRVTLVGVDPEYMIRHSEEFDEERSTSVRLGEQMRGLKAWQDDESGKGIVLRTKRWGRNWWNVAQNIFESESEREESRLLSEIVEFEWKGTTVEEEHLIEGVEDVYEGMR